MPGKPPHCLPRPTASALVGTEISNASAANRETKCPDFMIASLVDGCSNYRLHLLIYIRNDCQSRVAAEAQAFFPIQKYGSIYIQKTIQCPTLNGTPQRTRSTGPSMASGSSLPSMRFSI